MALEAAREPIQNDPPWHAPDWQAEADAWIRAALESHGARVTGPVETVKLSPWSAVLRAPTSVGAVFFKAAAPAIRHEIAITAALARWRPDCVSPVLASDLQRGWLLAPDGGARLREVVRSTRDFRHWEAVLPVYADLQIGLAGRVDELLHWGAPDKRLAALPEQYEQLLEDTDVLRIDREPGLSAAQYRQLRAMTPQVRGLCEALAGHGLPETLNHGDLGDANVFVRDQAKPVFFDWGDCAVSHPFYSLRTTFVSLWFSLQIDDGAPELERLRDVYLEAWTGFAPAGRLRGAFRLSQALASISGALGWYRVVAGLQGEAREEYAEPVPALLQEFLDNQAVQSAGAT